MTTPINGNAVLEKTRELCETIIAAPNVISIHQRINAFMADDQARSQYESVATKGQTLQAKRQQSLLLSNEEVSEFERERDALLANPVARSFLDAQEELHQVRESIQIYINRTFELGRVPAPEDLASCGHDCSCHH